MLKNHKTKARLFDLRRYCCPLFVPAILASAFLFSSSADTGYQLPGTAILNARIVTVSGPTIERGTILISNGLIEGVGTDLPIPADATVIEAKGLTVYPGLFDSLTDIGLQSAPSSASRAPGAAAATRGARGPVDRPGTTPWRNPIDELVDDPRIELWRNAGFTSVLTAPQNGIFPGQGIVINLARAQVKDLIVRDSAALLVKFERAPSLTDFPNSLMGVLGYVRQIFLDADYYVKSRPNRTNQSRTALPNDRALSTISEALQRNRPILLPANEAGEILRVQNLSNSLAIQNPVLYGGQGAYLVANELAKKKTSVLVSVKWPREEMDPDPEFVTSLRLLRFRERAPTTPSSLHSAGVRFAFYSDGLSSPAEMLKNVKESVDAGLPRDVALRALTLSPAEIFGVADKLGSIEPGKLANLIVTNGDLLEGAQVRITFVRGRAYEAPASQRPIELTPAQSPSAGSQIRSQPAAAEPLVDSRPVFISNATILTITHGTIERGSILIRNGKILEVGKNLKPPADALIVDATGQFVMPGIIDCHSHIGIEGTWYESGLNVSSIANIGDVLNSDDINIYRTLAGGVTTANVLYSSFNPIGGQTVVIKNRWGHPATKLLFEGAPPGIKFALGENPKRGTGIAGPFGPPQRYPKTRMGVIEVIREAFVEARDYKRRWDNYRSSKQAGDELGPPRRDLMLEPLVEVLEGKRLVHAHTYRADDILELIRVADEFDFKIASLQHAIEGYKVTREIASHRVGASTFSDWWAYKFEAYDAIPYNAALMAARGIVVSINSDSADEAHHLNHEAAKSMKWGGLSATEALKLITLNPAIQLRISDRVGSIEVGKDADLSIWNGHPLSIFAVVQKVLIDGRVYFDRQQDRARRVEVERQKKSLHDRKSISGVSERK
jgi:imidazolonepropionase-like amidohydrolase